MNFNGGKARAGLERSEVFILKSAQINRENGEQKRNKGGMKRKPSSGTGLYLIKARFAAKVNIKFNKTVPLLVLGPDQSPTRSLF